MPEEERNGDSYPSYIHVEQTLALIKPDAIDKADEIEEIILNHGFMILQVSFLLQLSWKVFISKSGCSLRD